jgi:tetratricopeptide (TPR) repeat protein
LWRAVTVLVVATFATYANSLRAPFVFDDIPSIRDNPSLQDLHDFSKLLTSPRLNGASADGRPVVNLSLALNRALGGEDVTGYHAFNVLVHAASVLVLFGLLRRTLAGARPLAGRFEQDAVPVAFVVALLFAVHPLETEAVTGITQRTESMAGLFLLLTLYCFARAVVPDGRKPATSSPVADVTGDGGRQIHLGFAMAACLLGAGTKEVMATAPVLVLLYDRTFAGGTFREAWRRRGWFHAALALSTWAVVAVLVWRLAGRGGTVGFGHGVTWWQYLLTQAGAIVMYLKLAVWPHPLVLDYGTAVVTHVGAVGLKALVVTSLVLATAWALVRRPVIGFLGAWFFVILGPSSSVVPIVTQTIAERRMYLPLAGVVVALVLVASRMVGRRAAVVVLAAGGLAVTSMARNHAYRSAEAIWTDSATKRPDNPRAQFALAQLADDAGRHGQAVEHGRAAVRLLPNDATAHFNLGVSLTAAGRLEEAAIEYQTAGRLRPGSVDPHVNLVGVLVRLGRLASAIAEAELVVRQRPDSGHDHFNLGEVYRADGRLAEAVAQYEAAVRLLPDSADAYFSLGNACAQMGRLEPAVAAYQEAVRLAPAHFGACVNLAGTLVRLGRVHEAVPYYERALRMQPGNAAVAGALERARLHAAL